MKLNEIIDPTLLNEMIKAKYVRVQMHPTLPLRIFNYSETCAYSKTWNAATLKTRGLIVDADDNIIARPFEKFFNSTEHDDPDRGGLPTDEPVAVTDKLDGSLGILYFVDSQPWIATRGSFASTQAQHATEVYRTRYHGHWEPIPGNTYLFEIVFPSNRIVLDYGDMDDLVLLGAVDIETGYTMSSHEAADESNWFGPVAQEFPYKSYAEALAAPPRENAEGIVVHFRDSDLRVKLKYETYVRLHKIITGTSTIGVWEHLRKGADLSEMLENVPDEFFDWVQATAADLTARKNAMVDNAREAFDYIGKPGDGETVDRKAFAMEAAQYGFLRPALFSLLDGKPIDDWAWKLVRPVHELPFQQSEAVA